MIASIRNDEVALHALLDAGCDPNVEVPPAGSAGYPAIQPDTQHWTALSFAASRANYVALRILLERGGKVEGGARSSEEKCTLTPLQLAAGTGSRRPDCSFPEWTAPSGRWLMTRSCPRRRRTSTMRPQPVPREREQAAVAAVRRWSVESGLESERTPPSWAGEPPSEWPSR